MPRSAIRLALAVTLLGLTAPLSAQEIHQAVQAADLDRVATLVDADPASLQRTNENGLIPLGLAIAFLDPNRREELYPVVAEQIRGLGYRPDFLLAEHPGDVFLMRRD